MLVTALMVCAATPVKSGPASGNRGWWPRCRSGRAGGSWLGIGRAVPRACSADRRRPVSSEPARKLEERRQQPRRRNRRSGMR